MLVIGEMSLWVALLMAAWTTVASLTGGWQRRQDMVRSGERAMYATFAFTALASVGIGAALFARDFSYKFVATHTSVNLPDAYAMSALWSGEPGALLVCALIAACYGTIAVVARRHVDIRQMPWIIATLGAMSLLLLMTLCFAANPYERVDWIAPDGTGMSPKLQSPSAALYRPTLVLGLLATIVPFACSIAALVTRRLDIEWLAAVRRWTLTSGFFLTLGMLLGMRAHYITSGLATFWMPDAAQNASFLAWLSSAALLHAPVIRTHRIGQRTPSLALVAVTFLVGVVATAATVVTANGEPASVHRLTQSPIVYATAALVVGASALFWYLMSSRLRDRADASLLLESGRRRRAGGVIVHVGAVVLLCALSGQLFRKDRVNTVRTGESISAVDAFGRSWRFRSLGVSRFEERNRRVLAASFDVSRDGQKRGLLSSEQYQYIDSQGEPIFEPFEKVAMLGSLTQDVYLVFSGSDDADTAAVRISFVPLVWWIWCGGIIMLCGGLVALWPAAQRDSVVGVVAMLPATPTHSPQQAGS